MANICFNCALCSWHYPSFRVTCDADGHEIKDVSREACGKFAEAEDEGAGE